MGHRPGDPPARTWRAGWPNSGKLPLGGPFETRVYGGGECREAQVDCETGVSASISLPRQLKVLNSHA